MVDHINNGESGLSVREKLNEVIDRTNTLNGSENQIEANKNLGQQNSARIDKEIQDRIDGDEELWDHVNDVEDQLQNLDVSVLDQKIDKEIADRIDGDANLQGQIDKEIADRTDGDAALQGQIDGLDLGGSIEEAPEDGKQYARKDASWSEIVPDAPSLLYGSWSYNSSSATTGSFTTRNANWFTATTLTLHKNDTSGYEHSFELMTEGDVIVLQAPSGGAEYRVISKTVYANFCDFVVDVISAFGSFPSNGYSVDFNFVPQTSSGAGMVISADEPIDPVEGMQWLDSTTAEVWIWDGERWLEFPAGSGGSSGGTNDDAVVQSGTEDQQVVSKFTFTANPTQDEMGFTNAPNKLVVDVDEKRTSFIAGSPNSSTWDSSDPWDVDIQGSLNIKALGAPYSDMQYTSNGLSNYGGSLTLEANGTANFSSQVKMMDGRLRAFLGDAGKEVALSFKKIDGLETIRMYSDESGNLIFRDNENYTNRLTLDVSGNATVHGSVTATSPSNAGAPTSTIDPAILLMGGDSSVGDGGEIGFGAFTNRKFAAIKGSISDANSNGAGHLDFYTRENPNTAEMSRALRITSNGNATFSGSVTAGPVTAETMQIRGNRLYDSGTDGIGLYFTKSGNAILPTDNNGQLVDGGPDLGNQQRKFKNGFFSGTVNGARVVQDGSPVIDAKGLITTLTTLRNATKDETTLEGLRDSIGNAIGGLIEKFEAEIATMETPE